MSATDYDFLANRNEIIAAAYRKIGVLSFGQPISADLMEEGAFALNLVIQDWQNKNVFLWSKRILTLPLISAQSTYIPDDPGIIGIEKAYLQLLSDKSDKELEILSLDDYMHLIRKDESGQPKVVNFRFSQNASIVLWPVPDVQTSTNYQLSYTGISRLKDWDVSNGSGDIPSRYQLALIYDLASYLASDHAIPAGERDRLQAAGGEAFRAARQKDSDRSELEICTGAFSTRGIY